MQLLLLGPFQEQLLQQMVDRGYALRPGRAGMGFFQLPKEQLGQKGFLHVSAPEFAMPPASSFVKILQNELMS
ncbi:MAG: hypothetical protein IPJ00_09675 [Saprospirales bacterium]|nr:hypothetical protein [Saprospirales bacterium]